MDWSCYGQHSHENESRTEIRREPFIRAVLVLDKTCSYKWYSSCLIFPRINGPIVSALYFTRLAKLTCKEKQIKNVGRIKNESVKAIGLLLPGTISDKAVFIHVKYDSIVIIIVSKTTG